MRNYEQWKFYVMLCELYLAAERFRASQKINSTLKSSMQHGMKAQGQQAPPERKRMPRPVNQAHPPDLLVVAEIKREKNWPVLTKQRLFHQLLWLKICQRDRKEAGGKVAGNIQLFCDLPVVIFA